MGIIAIIGIILLITTILSILILRYEVNQQQNGKPLYSKEVLEDNIKRLKKEIKCKIANDEEFRLEADLDYLEFYENELKKYQK